MATKHVGKKPQKDKGAHSMKDTYGNHGMHGPRASGASKAGQGK